MTIGLLVPLLTACSPKLDWTTYEDDTLLQVSRGGQYVVAFGLKREYFLAGEKYTLYNTHGFTIKPGMCYNLNTGKFYNFNLKGFIDRNSKSFPELNSSDILQAANEQKAPKELNSGS